jgi:hypothetical protein
LKKSQFCGTIASIPAVLYLNVVHRGYATTELEESGQMPIMSGIAAFAVLATGTDQGGVDPQIDKQFAIVKQGAPITPVVVPTNASDDSTPGIARVTADRAISQDGGFTVVQSGQAKGGQSTAPETSMTVILGDKLVTVPSSLPSGYSAAQRATSMSGFTYLGNDNLSKLKGMDRQVSVQFTNATAADVLKWLSKQNVNFVANVDKLPKTKVTMNVSNVPLHEALESVADALGGSWQVKGSTLIFQTGMFHTMPFPATKLGSMSPFSAKGFGGESFVPLSGKEFQQFGKLNELQMKDLEKSMSDLKIQMKSMPKMDMKGFSELKAFPGEGKAFDFKMDPKALAELKSLNGDLFSKDGKTYLFKSDPKNPFGDFKKLNGMTFKKVDAEKLSKSLSNSQKDLLKKQGYLKFSDLTEAQKTMLFDGSTKEMPQDFTFVFSVNGEKITIKKQ